MSDKPTPNPTNNNQEHLVEAPPEPKGTKWMYLGFLFLIFIPIVIYEYYSLAKAMKEPLP